jgi:chemotaxis protein CheD
MTVYLSSPEPIEIFLRPGEFWFGDAHTRIRTLLGSCVAITMWHPKYRVGGMCHYMLGTSRGGCSELDGRYAEDAIALFLDELRANCTRPKEYEVKLFGGGRMFAPRRGGRGVGVLDIGRRNIEIGRRLLAAEGFHVAAEHLGGNGHRNIIFDIATGSVWMRHVPRMPSTVELGIASGE